MFLEHDNEIDQSSFSVMVQLDNWEKEQKNTHMENIIRDNMWLTLWNGLFEPKPQLIIEHSVKIMSKQYNKLDTNASLWSPI